MARRNETRSPFSPVTYYVSEREGRLRLAILAGFAPLPVTLFLLTQAPAEFWPTPWGGAGWWLLPSLLTLLSVVLPWLVCRWHDCYVLRLERTPDGRWLITTLLLWGLRTREMTSAEFERVGQNVRTRDGRVLIFDRRGEVPLGWEAIRALWETRVSAGAI